MGFIEFLVISVGGIDYSWGSNGILSQSSWSSTTPAVGHSNDGSSVCFQLPTTLSTWALGSVYYAFWGLCMLFLAMLSTDHDAVNLGVGECI